MKRHARYFILLFLVFVLTIVITRLKDEMKAHTFFVKEYCSSDAFREQVITEDCFLLLQEQAMSCDIDQYEYLAAAFLYEKGSLMDAGQIHFRKEKYKKLHARLIKNAAFEELVSSLKAIWKDIRYFPVPASAKNSDAGICYENSWMYERSFGGARSHEGCDVMADINKRGYYPVISMTDGIVEKIGWLPQGGYRIGIRSESGGYFYYAHLYEYAEQFETGSQVLAGQLLGYMGDSGYGEEGTIGKFDVHLHIGIYIATSSNHELSVNPYYVLNYLEKKKLNYFY